MRRMLQLPAALALVAAPALAQNPDARSNAERRILTVRADEANRAVIGVTTSAGVRARDTLGLIVTAITPNSPAEKAGIEEGDRLQAIGGTTLRLAPGDTGDAEMRGIMQRRLERELRKVKPGDEVELRVYTAGRTRTVRVKTVPSDSLYPEERLRTTAASFRVGRLGDEDRASLGIGIGATGSRRDTLGVFVFSVNDSGPAATAGVEEGSRIASVNGVDLRVAGADAGDEMVGQAKVRRLQREVERLKPGDEVTLRIFQNGQFRTVKVKAARASDLPRRGGSFFMTGDMWGPMPMPPVPPVPPMAPMPRMRFDFDGQAIGDQIQRSLDRALEGVDRAMVSLRSWARN